MAAQGFAAQPLSSSFPPLEVAFLLRFARVGEREG